MADKTIGLVKRNYLSSELADDFVNKCGHPIYIYIYKRYIYIKLALTGNAATTHVYYLVGDHIADVLWWL